ncbi:PREDICTED: nitrogen permease regulator 3-like protein isoform X2 [Nicrophorus vespilloides]|uniref:GATOR complex protein NPRL3 n=1 Tax=Nicrophorus vespilloides TaxID=110193 RepID=A0ABM1M4U5_NICVS|nr:PREDICTED: nitrogen permease regulator 3-like protein isoform X2 [Nicrophorus vespilloides]
MEVNPLSIILVKSDSKGDRLLFRYPFHMQEKNEPSNARRRNPYTLPIVDDSLQTIPQPRSNINKCQLTGFTDEVLSSLFAVKPELCNRKFELKVNDVRFVSHPTLLQLRKKQLDTSGCLLINVVFALQALATHSVVKCYHDLSKLMGILLEHEETRCGYVNDEMQVMMTAHDDGYASNPDAAFLTILEKSILAKNLKKMYEDLCGTGLVNIRINRWIPLNFCLPQKVHQWHLQGKLVEPEDIDRCIKSLRPYHSLLLLCPVQSINDFISLDGSPSLKRMLTQYSPLKNLQTLATDSDLTPSHIFDLTAHLVYWARATVIYPICSTNKYVIAPEASLHLNSPLVDKFSELFQGMNLIRAISEFSLPTSLGQKCNPLHHPSQQSTLVQMIIWMLQNHLLLQLHTYIQFMIADQFVANQSESESISATRKMRTESESGTSTISEGLESKSEAETKNSENFSYNSTDEDKHDYHEELLLDFTDEERSIIFKIPASNNTDDLRLFARLCRKKYFTGNHHIEEIMYLENLRRSQLLQLLDKFRDVLITYETEDPTIAMFSCP